MGKPKSKATARANAAKSSIRAHVEHVFAHQKNRFNLFIRTIGLARAETKTDPLQPGLQLQPPDLPRASRNHGLTLRASKGNRRNCPSKSPGRSKCCRFSAWLHAITVSSPAQTKTLQVFAGLQLQGSHARVAQRDPVPEPGACSRGDLRLGGLQSGRPHSSIGYETPAAFAAELHKQRPASLRPTCSAAQAIARPALMRKKAAFMRSQPNQISK